MRSLGSPPLAGTPHVARRSRPGPIKRPAGTSLSAESRRPRIDEPSQRLVLTLPWRLYSLALELAHEQRARSVESYCLELLEGKLQERQAERERDRDEDRQRQFRLENLAGITDDPSYLEEWSSAVSRGEVGLHPTVLSSIARPLEGPPPQSSPRPEDHATVPHSPTDSSIESSLIRAASGVVLRHAALEGDDPTAFLPSLRRGEPLEVESTRELLLALNDLETGLQGSDLIDRKLAFALHRLAYEGQILLTESSPRASVDRPTLDRLRLVQEAVDRVLSGEDIRYFSADNRWENAS